MAEATEEKVVVAPPAGLPIKLVIIIAVVTLLLGLGAALVFVKLTGKEHVESSPKEAKAAAPEKHAEATTKVVGAAGPPGAIYDLDPFIVNLADAPESRYLKITVKLELDRPEVSGELAGRVPHVRDAVLILLTSKEASALRSPQGKFQLREEITERVNALLPKGGVRSAYFTEFVVQ
ncbi:flagellar basal body-associated FliL family protein [Candidatus Nitrospira bockiana]